MPPRPSSRSLDASRAILSESCQAAGSQESVADSVHIIFFTSSRKEPALEPKVLGEDKAYSTGEYLTNNQRIQSTGMQAPFAHWAVYLSPRCFARFRV